MTKPNYLNKVEVKHMTLYSAVVWELPANHWAAQAEEFHTSWCLGLLFGPENGGSTFLWNIGELLPDYIVSHLGRLLVIITANFKSSKEGTASPPFKFVFRDSGESKTKEWIHVIVSLPWPTLKSQVPCCFNPDTSFKFALFLKRNLNAWLWTFYGSAKNNGACPASAVIWWVLFVTFWCMVLSIHLVIQVSAAWLFMRAITLLSRCLGNLQQALK